MKLMGLLRAAGPFSIQHAAYVSVHTDPKLQSLNQN